MNAHEERMNRIAEFFANITVDEFEDMLIEAGAGRIKDCSEMGFRMISPEDLYERKD